MWRRHRGRVVLAGILIAVGLVWIGQGAGALQGSSFMVDDVRWAVAGAALVVIAAGLLLDARRR